MAVVILLSPEDSFPSATSHLSDASLLEPDASSSGPNEVNEKRLLNAGPPEITGLWGLLSAAIVSFSRRVFEPPKPSGGSRSIILAPTKRQNTTFTRLRCGTKAALILLFAAMGVTTMSFFALILPRVIPVTTDVLGFPGDTSASMRLSQAAIEYQVSLRANASDFGLSLDELDGILAGVADANRTVMLVPFNYAFIHILANLLCSIQRMETANGSAMGLPLVFWPLDKEAQRWSERANIGPILYDESLFSVSDNVEYSGSDKTTPYFLMMRERGKMFRRIVHDLGYNVFFLDSDIVLLGNPLDLLRWDSSVEIQIDAINSGQAHMIEVVPAPGPEEVKEPEESAEAGRMRILSGPANPKPIPFFRPESSYGHAGWDVIGCAGVFFIRSDEGGRFVARELERILAERADVDDQQALNIILKENGWPRNLAPLRRVGNREGANYEGEERVLTYRYLPQYATPNGHVFFEAHAEYERVKKEMGAPEPTLVHANGRHDKEAAFREHRLWYLHERQCLWNITSRFF
ncbi:hypothetical protein HK101_002155 [Irineochytrium annulatum]|nr:hypothetical protein HK101_002155 [Irineochytrium annulatum]